MSLEEDRAKKDAEEKWLPKRQQALRDLCGGGEVSYEVDWPSFAGDLKGIQWCENNGPAMVEQAFRLVGKDDMGKQALREKVKRVVVRNCSDAKAKKVTFAGGILDLTCSYAQGTTGRVDGFDIQKCLLKGL